MPSVFFIGKLGLKSLRVRWRPHEVAGQHQAPSPQARDVSGDPCLTPHCTSQRHLVFQALQMGHCPASQWVWLLHCLGEKGPTTLHPGWLLCWSSICRWSINEHGNVFQSRCTLSVLSAQEAATPASHLTREAAQPPPALLPPAGGSGVYPPSSPSASGTRGSSGVRCWVGSVPRWCSPSRALVGTPTHAAPLKWSVRYPDHLCSVPVILCRVFSSTPVFFSSRSHLSFSCFLLSRRGFVNSHHAPPPDKLVPPPLRPPSPLRNVTGFVHGALSSRALSPLRRPVLGLGSRVSRGRWQPNLGQGWGGAAHSRLLEKPLTSQARVSAQRGPAVLSEKSTDALLPTWNSPLRYTQTWGLLPWNTVEIVFDKNSPLVK